MPLEPLEFYALCQARRKQVSPCEPNPLMDLSCRVEPNLLAVRSQGTLSDFSRGRPNRARC